MDIPERDDFREYEEELRIKEERERRSEYEDFRGDELYERELEERREEWL